MQKIKNRWRYGNCIRSLVWVMVREQVYLEAEFGSAFHVCQPEAVGSVFGFAYAAKLKSE